MLRPTGRTKQAGPGELTPTPSESSGPPPRESGNGLGTEAAGLLRWEIAADERQADPLHHG